MNLSFIYTVIIDCLLLNLPLKAKDLTKINHKTTSKTKDRPIDNNC